METKNLIEVLKKALKSHGVTYADIAAQLNLSEASVKRMFAQKHFTLIRLESICEMAQMDFTDLIRLMDEERQKISNLTLEQEEELVSDLKFLLVAICVQSNWTFNEMIDYFKITGPECIGYLVRLDRLGLIQLLPNNRIRQMVAKNFRWLPRGPIEKFFEQTAQNEFLDSHFTHPGELRLFMNGSLTWESIESIRKNVEALAHEFSSFQDDDARMPATTRFNTGLLLAMRPWELPIFSKLKKRDVEE
ncbi:MAG: hypothetical protein A2W69_05140 [Gammaproteobacteria bacterium RIFCSPLOWO2_02_47_7]|nr:MAG: hypothetical protein A2W69_05140 [Gammaproteobacteria bacterium RIFCSPLOWO2_02_47_7]OGT72802.1 MAG: hypothetical protein A2W76_02015 [Gammaproteobacteria bacterium RIFCSPLOWO2_12_47_11]